MTKKKTSTNSNLRKAAKNKNDEFYTQLSDIENELSYYKEHFKNKIIYCNCDDPYRSNFVKYFALNFKFLGIKQLIATCYKHPDIDDSHFENVADRPIKWVYNGEQLEGQNYPDLSKAIVTNLEGDGDFRSEECLSILKDCDLVITNPPFSLFREFVDIIINYKKQFLLIGSKNAITYKGIFPLLRDNKVWLGYNVSNGTMHFIQETLKLKGIPSFWYTNLEHDKRNQELILYKKYNKEEYPKYDNYDAININRVKDIPCDYKGIMGVPITFLSKHNPNQFEIIGIGNTTDYFTPIKTYINPKEYKSSGKIVSGSSINNVQTLRSNTIPSKGSYFTADCTDYYIVVPYARLFIRNRKPQLD